MTRVGGGVTRLVRNLTRRFEWVIGEVLAAWLPKTVLHSLAVGLSEREPEVLLEAIGPRLSRQRTLEDMVFDLPAKGPLRFEHLAGLFASTSLDHAVIAMTIRQAAYVFGLIRETRPRKVIEIGRYKGGSTLLIAAAMDGSGEFWSIDNGDKEARLHPQGGARGFDEQILEICRRFDLRVNLIVGDSRWVEVDTGEVDLVFIDGDHAYETVKSDFDRFGRRVRVGGAVLLDDAFDDGIFNSHSATVGRLVNEIIAYGEFRLVKAVNRLAHVERVEAAA